MASNTQGLQDLQAALAAETVQSAAVVAAFQSVAQQISALQAQIAALQAQQGEVTDAQLEQFAQTLNQAQATVAAVLPAGTAPASNVKSAS